jgi:hypothetical protein
MDIIFSHHIYNINMRVWDSKEEAVRELYLYCNCII